MQSQLTFFPFAWFYIECMGVKGVHEQLSAITLVNFIVLQVLEFKNVIRCNTLYNIIWFQLYIVIILIILYTHSFWEAVRRQNPGCNFRAS